MIDSIISELSMNAFFYIRLLFEHIFITSISISIAILVGLSIGIWISYHPRIANYIISIVNVIYTIPSIALLGFLVSFSGIGNITAIIAITVYALLPIVRNTYVGITNIDPKIVEASKAMGSKEYQTLYKIKLPLAFPIIFAAIRNMVIMTIALAGIASFVGAGGLGVAIYRGITTNNEVLILIGSFIIALLALTVDGILGIIGKIVEKRKFKKLKSKKFLSIILALAVSLSIFSLYHTKNSNTIEIASKPTTEGYILAEIVAEAIRKDTGLKVNITHGVGGGTSNIHPGILKGDFDLYPEYTGTSWQIVLKRKEPYREENFDELNKEYENNYKLTWKGLFGFNNTYSLGIRKDLAQKYNIKTFSDLSKYAREFTFGAEYDFFEREDGYKVLSNAYNFNFKKAVDLDNGLKYQALFDQKIDVMTVFTTDGQLSDPRILVLKDDRNFYPQYKAGIVLRMDTLQNHPELNKVLNKFVGLIDEKTMAMLNNKVEIGKENPKDVAVNFLKEKGF